jgi:RNA-directed DNA polymerase
MKIYCEVFDRITAPENLFTAWEAFKQGKRGKSDVMEFERDLEQNIFQLHRDLKSGAYRHGPYAGFYIHDPKQRHIHKAKVRDRVLHHAVFSVINPIFEPTFISASFSCRIGYGTHKGVDVLAKLLRQCAQNGAHDCFVLKADIQKFFDNIDHVILIEILERKIKDERAMQLLKNIIESYSSRAGSRERERERERVNAAARPEVSPSAISLRSFLRMST